MDQDKTRMAAEIVWSNWRDGLRFDGLPQECRPHTVQSAYAVQALLETISKERVVGWKIAATSAAGQSHIAVDGPMAGRLFAGRVRTHPATVRMGANNMRVAEAEFAFVLKRDLPSRDEKYDLQEVMKCVDTLHPAIEIPDSRFEDFTKAGAAQLVADNACAHWFVLGAATDANWRGIDLSQHHVIMRNNGEVVVQGRGADVLGDPRIALTWLANQHHDRGEGLRAGQIITTGVCGKPSPISSGDHVVADFGTFGQVEVRFVD